MANEKQQPVAWYRWSELYKKRIFTDEQPTEELAWIPLYTEPRELPKVSERRKSTSSPSGVSSCYHCDYGMFPCNQNCISSGD